MKAHLESKVASLSSAVLDEVEVRLGHFYCFQGVRSDELWLARVEAIFREKFAHDEVSLTVRWLYGPTDAWRYKVTNGVVVVVVAVAVALTCLDAAVPQLARAAVVFSFGSDAAAHCAARMLCGCGAAGVGQGQC